MFLDKYRGAGDLAALRSSWLLADTPAPCGLVPVPRLPGSRPDPSRTVTPPLLLRTEKVSLADAIRRNNSGHIGLPCFHKTCLHSPSPTRPVSHSLPHSPRPPGNRAPSAAMAMKEGVQLYGDRRLTDSCRGNLTLCRPLSLVRNACPDIPKMNFIFLRAGMTDVGLSYGG